MLGLTIGFKPSKYEMLGGGTNVVNHYYTTGDGLGAEIVGTPDAVSSMPLC